MTTKRYSVYWRVAMSRPPTRPKRRTWRFMMGCEEVFPRLPPDCAHARLAHGAVHFLVEVRRLEQLARLRSIRRPDQPIVVHHVHQVSRTSVTDAQATLQQRRAGLAELEDQPHRVVEELV